MQFTFKFPEDKDVVWLAFNVPYTYSTLVRYLNNINVA